MLIKNFPKKKVFGYVDEAVVFGNFYKVTQAVSEAALQCRIWTS